MKSVRVVSLFLILISPQAWSYGVACQLVAQIAGSKDYQAQPLRMASLRGPADIPSSWDLSVVDKHGAWHVYQAPQPWMTKKQCAPLDLYHAGQKFEFVPVILNKQTGHNAVIIGNFIIKVYRREHLDRVIERYAFKTLSPLPNPESLIVDVRPQRSYDELISELDKDKDVRFALPILSEPRPRR